MITSKYKIILKAICVNGEGKVLIVKRGEGAPSRALVWDLPGGNLDKDDITDYQSESGTGDDGDILVQGLRRELREELGAEPVVGSIVTIHTASGYAQEKDKLILLIGFKCTLDTTNIKLNEEHVEFKWVSKDELIKIDMEDKGIMSIITHFEEDSTWCAA